jgi:hypothetical protein
LLETEWTEGWVVLWPSQLQQMQEMAHLCTIPAKGSPQCIQLAKMEEQDRSSKRRKHEKSADSAGMVAAAQAFLTRTPLSAVARADQKLTVLEHSDTVARAMQVHAAASAPQTARCAVPGPSTLSTHSGTRVEMRRDEHCLFVDLWRFG